jgi:hypothetical protein
MATRLPLLGEVARQALAASEWQVTVKKVLPPEVANRVSAASLKDGQLVVFTESAAWAARLRYALSEHEAALLATHKEVREIVVRVSPAASKASGKR